MWNHGYQSAGKPRKKWREHFKDEWPKDLFHKTEEDETIIYSIVLKSTLSQRGEPRKKLREQPFKDEFAYRPIPWNRRRWYNYLINCFEVNAFSNAT